MPAVRAVFLIFVAVSALAIGVFLGGSIAQPALLGLVPWSSNAPHNS